MLDYRSWSSRWRRRALALSVALCACAVFAIPGCGGESSAEIDRTLPDREQIEAVVLGFYDAIARDDVSAACEHLSPAGRGVAIAKRVPLGSAIPPATKEQCANGEPFPGLLGNVVLKGVLDGGGLRISKIDITGPRANVILSAGAIDGVQRLSETPEGWKIDRYENPVRV